MENVHWLSLPLSRIASRRIAATWFPLLVISLVISLSGGLFLLLPTAAAPRSAAESQPRHRCPPFRSRRAPPHPAYRRPPASSRRRPSFIAHRCPRPLRHRRSRLSRRICHLRHRSIREPDAAPRAAPLARGPILSRRISSPALLIRRQTRLLKPSARDQHQINGGDIKQRNSQGTE